MGARAPVSYGAGALLSFKHCWSADFFRNSCDSDNTRLRCVYYSEIVERVFKAEMWQRRAFSWDPCFACCHCRAFRRVITWCWSIFQVMETPLFHLPTTTSQWHWCLTLCEKFVIVIVSFLLHCIRRHTSHLHRPYEFLHSSEDLSVQPNLSWICSVKWFCHCWKL